MSYNTPAPEKAEHLPSAALMFPFATLDAIGSRILASFKTKPKPQQQPQPELIESVKKSPDISFPAITPNLHYVIADRAVKAIVNGRNLCLYHYVTYNVIRIVCRELHHLKPIDFTPDIAENNAVIFDIDGAIQWVRKTGLEAAPITAKTYALKASKTEVVRDTTRTSPAVKGGHDTTAPMSVGPSVQNTKTAPSSAPKGASFTGRIISFGNITRTGSYDKKPYVTYAMKLQSESGAYDKEFIGEHLLELVSEMNLTEGQLVCIQPLGKIHFEVEVKGIMQQRSYNQFSITPLE